MKYTLMIRSRPAADEPIPERHARLMAQLFGLAPPWQPRFTKWRPAKDAGSQPMSVVNFRGVLGQGLTGSANYQNRRYTPDEAKADDWVSFDFDPNKFDYRYVVETVFPSLIVGFGAYVARIHDAEFYQIDFDRWRRSGNNDRYGVFRFYPVQYFDRQLCRRAFGITPRQLIRCLAKHVEHASDLSDGALIVTSSEILSLEQAKRIEGRIRPLVVDRQTK